jgi:hypothetical protein
MLDVRGVGMSASGERWNTKRAAQLAHEAYRYVARTYPPDAPLEPLGRADAAMLEAQEQGDWSGYEEALRELCRVARREAIRAQRSRRVTCEAGGGA